MSTKGRAGRRPDDQCSCGPAESSAWTNRARVIAGPAALRARIEAAIVAALAAAGPPERVRADAASMRARLARELPPAGPWDGYHLSEDLASTAIRVVAPHGSG